MRRIALLIAVVIGTVFVPAIEARAACYWTDPSRAPHVFINSGECPDYVVATAEWAAQEGPGFVVETAGEEAQEVLDYVVATAEWAAQEGPADIQQYASDILRATGAIPCAAASGARPGDVVTDVGGLGVEVPPPGRGVFTEALLLKGAQQLAVETTSTGSVLASFCGSEIIGDGGPNPGPTEPDPADPEQTNPSAPDPCADDFYVLHKWKWYDEVSWYFNGGSAPNGIGINGAEAAIKQAANSYTNARNTCGMADNIMAKDNYQQRTGRSADIRPHATQPADICAKSDGYSVVDFGNRPSGELGRACVWFDPGTPKKATAGDIRLNKEDYIWTLDPYGSSCGGTRWSIRAVVTHEWGHVFGLDHVDETTHGNLTASPDINGPCQDSEFTLGRGDITGLRQRY